MVSKKRYLYSVFRTTSLRIFCAHPLLYSLLYGAKDGPKESSFKQSTKKKALENITVFSPTCITNSKNPFFVLVFCIGPRYTRLWWWLDNKMQLQFIATLLWCENSNADFLTLYPILNRDRSTLVYIWHEITARWRLSEFLNFS